MRRVRDEKGYVDVVMVLLITALLLVMVGAVFVDASDRVAVANGLEPSGWRGLLPSKAFMSNMLSWGARVVIAVIVLNVTVVIISKGRRLFSKRFINSKQESTPIDTPAAEEEWIGETLDNFAKQIEFQRGLKSAGKRSLLEQLLEIDAGLVELEKVSEGALRQELGNKYGSLIDRVSYLVSDEYWGDILANSRCWDNSKERLTNVESGVERVGEALRKEVRRIKGLDSTAEVSLRFIENALPVDEMTDIFEGTKQIEFPHVQELSWFEKLGEKIGLGR